MPLNFFGGAGLANSEPASAGAAAPFSFGQPPGYFPVDLPNSGAIAATFLDTFENEPDLTEHDRGLLVEGIETLDAQIAAVRNAGGIYFAHGLHPDPRLGVAESYLAVYVRDTAIGNPRSVLAAFAEAAAGEPGIRAVSRQDFVGGPAVTAEYEHTFPAVSTERLPTTDRVTLRQLRAAFSFPDGDKLTIIELTTRHTTLWSDYRSILPATANTVNFEPLDELEEEPPPDAQDPETVSDRLSRLLG